MATLPEIKRTYRISLERDPAISGYGGWDEWTIGPLTATSRPAPRTDREGGEEHG